MIAGIIILAGYLVGSVPFGLLISKMAGGIDPRRQGSRNIGATNVLRVVGKKEAAFTLFCDFLKGFLPVVVAKKVGLSEGGILLAGFAPIIGHIFPVFLKFRGGKGVATSFGVFVGLVPQVALSAFVLWIGGIYFGKYSSIGALAAFGALPFLSLLFRPDPLFILFSLAVAVIVYIRHWENILRLLKGTEGHAQRQ